MDVQNSLEIILHSGNAKTCIMMAIENAEKGLFGEAEAKLAEANDEILLAHQQHQSMLVQLANGEKVEVDLLIVHAEDHLNSAEEQIFMARNLIKIYKRMEEK